MNSSTNILSNDKHEMCRLLVDQFTSVFTIPDPQQIITDPVSFFAHAPNTGINKSLFLTDIKLNEDIISEAIHELYPILSSRSRLCSFIVTGQLCYRASPCVIVYFSHSLSPWSYPKILEESCYYCDLQFCR